MPELPEVETVARAIREQLSDARIETWHVEREDYVRVLSRDDPFTGRTLRTVDRHGKRIRIVFDPWAEMILHLGMSGRVELCPPDVAPEPHTHLRLVLEKLSVELRVRDPRRFGGVWVRTDPDQAWPKTRPFGSLGPDALTITARDFGQLLDRDRQIKALLLDQQRIAGIGNIYADEALHGAGIHPLRQARDLSGDERKELLRQMRGVLRKAIRMGGSTLRDYRTPGRETGAFQRVHRVYGREGEPCDRCGHELEKILVASRSSHLCPKCQPRRTRRKRR